MNIGNALRHLVISQSIGKRNRNLIPRVSGKKEWRGVEGRGGAGEVAKIARN